MEAVHPTRKIAGSPQGKDVVIAVGDVHGEYGLLQRLVTTAKRLIPTDATKVDFVVLGDMLDRGTAAIEVIDFLRHGVDDWNVLAIMGNHEQLLLRLLNAEDDSYSAEWVSWWGNGGLPTLENLNIMLPSPSEVGISKHRTLVKGAFGQDRLSFLHQLPSHYRNGDILCVHGGIDPELSLDDNFAKDRLSKEARHWAWIRQPFLNYEGSFDQDVFVVHGHTVTPMPTVSPHRLGLDTGACLHGLLSAALFYQGEMTLFQVATD